MKAKTEQGSSHGGIHVPRLKALRTALNDHVGVDVTPPVYTPNEEVAA